MSCTKVFFTIFFQSYAQVSNVGINTLNPLSALDVNGNIRLRGELLLGGNDSIPGSPGNAGDAVLSQGKGLSPMWKHIDPYIPPHGEYRLLKSVVNTSETGLRFAYNQLSGANPYSFNQVLSRTDFNSGRWKVFDELTIDLPQSIYPLKVVISFQAVATSGYIGSPGVEGFNSFAIGVCSDDPNNSNQKLIKAITGSTCMGINNPQTLFTLYTIIDDLPVDQRDKLYVVGTQRNISYESEYERAELVIGMDLTNSQNDQSFLKLASVKADIYEKIR